jgi:glycerol uptake facilitator-like aquaporin
LILALGVISGGHFNPLITILLYMTRRRGGICALAYIAAQLAGGVAGAVLATFAFGATRQPAGLQNPGHGWLLAELLSSAGLMLVVFGCTRSARTEFGALGVAAWLTGSVLGLPNTFANPALALGATSALGGALTWHHLQLAIAAEVGGALLAAAVVAYLFSTEISLSPPVAVEKPVKRESVSQSEFRA